MHPLVPFLGMPLPPSLHVKEESCIALTRHFSRVYCNPLELALHRTDHITPPLAIGRMPCLSLQHKLELQIWNPCYALPKVILRPRRLASQQVSPAPSMVHTIFLRVVFVPPCSAHPCSSVDLS